MFKKKNHIVVENGKHPKFSKRKKLTIIIIILSVILLSIVTVALYSWYQDSLLVAGKKRITETSYDAQTYVNNGDVDGAKALYDKAIDATDDVYQKSILLAGKALILLNNGDYDKALAIALDALKIDENRTTTSLLADIYEAKSDKENAIKYMQKTITLIDETQTNASEDIQAYKDRITRLSETDK